MEMVAMKMVLVTSKNEMRKSKFRKLKKTDILTEGYYIFCRQSALHLHMSGYTASKVPTAPSRRPQGWLSPS